MDNRQDRTLHTFERILVYLERNPVRPEPPLLTKMKHSLAASIARVSGLDVEQRTAARLLSGARARDVRRHMRRDVLMPLVRIAKPLLKFAPGTQHVLRVPHARANTATIATHALDMAKALTPHAKLLASAGYSRDFLVQLETDARQLAAATTEADKARQRQSRNTAAIRQELKKAMGTVSVIEGILMAHGQLKDRKSTDVWRGARRVQARAGRPPKRRRNSADAVVPPTSSQ